MDEHTTRRIDEMEKELHLNKHRLTVLEQEQLPRRVAVMEPIVQRLENKLDDLGDQIDSGLSEVKSALLSQKSMQKGVVVTVVAATGFIQLLPYLERFIR